MPRPRQIHRPAIAALGLALTMIAPTSAANSSIATVSAGCASSQNAEVQQTIDGTSGAAQGTVYVYEDWMGCGGIAFARSTDGGLHFSAPIALPGTSGSSVSTTWDPAIAVRPDGAVYAVFIVSKSSEYYPVVAKSTDHGATFNQVTSLIPPPNRNWGDRPFIAVDPGNAQNVYVTWDYGPSRATISYLCATGGSCAFSSGDLNVVIQASTDGGKTFGPIVPINPAFPTGGGDSAPILVDPTTGRLDVLYQGYQILDPVTAALGPAVEYFTSSGDQGMTWSAPVAVDPSAGTMSLAEWWINGSLAADEAGNLYAAWDTQAPTTDTSWLAYSTDHGQTWSPQVQITADVDLAPHITQVTGGGPGVAVVGVLSDASANGSIVGYSLALRRFQIPRGSGGGLSSAIVVSSQLGDPSVWPGDTFGLSTINSSTVATSWGSAYPATKNKKSQIFAALVGY